MTSNIDYIGKRFGRLLVINSAPSLPKKRRWLCKCDCGNEYTVITAKLNNGHVRSCGCMRSETARARMQTHKMSGSITHKRWKSMLSRCFTVNSKSYPRYGGRGITVCAQWKDSFEIFLRDMGECPDDGLTLERKETDGNYEPSNCKWATRKEQNRNTSRNRLLEYHGEKRCVSEWAEILGLSVNTIYKRIYAGKSDEEALAK